MALVRSLARICDDCFATVPLKTICPFCGSKKFHNHYLFKYSPDKPEKHSMLRSNLKDFKI